MEQDKTTKVNSRTAGQNLENMDPEQRRALAAKKRRARALAKRRMVLLLTTILLITVGTIVFGSCFSLAQDSEAAMNQEYKYYTSIQIQEGDSLWSIAEEYRNHNTESVFEYIDTLKEVNGLHSDDIHEGQYLTIAYYEVLK